MNAKTTIFWSIFVAAAAFRLWRSLAIPVPDIGPCLKANATGTGTIVEEPTRTETGQTIVVRAESLSAEGGHVQTSCRSDLQIKIKTKLYPRFDLGDHISFSGKLLEPFNFSSKEDPGRSFDYRGYLAKDGIYYEMRSARATRIASGLEGQSFFAKATSFVSQTLFGLKMSFVSDLDRTLGEPHAALAAGLVVGEKAALGKDLLQDFRTVGLIHIVVLSGYNITIVAAALRRMLSFLPRAWGIAAGALGIILFGILVGGGATVVRSCFMAGIALSADLARRDYSVHRALALAALVMVIQNPMIVLHDPSFQLSFLATAGLLLLAGPVERHLGFITERLGIRGIVASTIATQIFVSPFILYMMGQISLIGMVVNILVLPLIPATMLFVTLTGLVGMVSYAASLCFAWVSHIFLSYELFMVTHFARVPFAAAHMPAFSIWWVVGFYAAFAATYAVWVLTVSKKQGKVFPGSKNYENQ